jgi:hypothetical protein
MNNNDVHKLEHKADIKMARPVVAEDLGWLIACIAAVVTAIKFNLLIGAFIGFLGFFLVTLPYRARMEKAVDALLHAPKQKAPIE